MKIDSLKVVLVVIAVLIFLPIHKIQAIPPPEMISGFSTFFWQIFILFSVVAVSFLAAAKKVFKKVFKFNLLKAFIFVILILSFSVAGVYVFNRQAMSSNPVIGACAFNKQAMNSKMSLAHAKDRKIKNDQKKYKTVTGINSDEFRDWFKNSEKLEIFDLRYKKDYEAGHLQGARYWDKSWTDQDIENIAKSLDSNTKVVFYCTEGVRSSQNAAWLKRFHSETYYLNDWPVLPEYWQGDMHVSKVEPPKVISIDVAKKFIKKGAVIINPRSKRKYDEQHINNSVNIPVSELTFSQAIDVIGVNINDEGFIVSCNFNHKFECQILHYLIRYINSECHGLFDLKKFNEA